MRCTIQIDVYFTLLYFRLWMLKSRQTLENCKSDIFTGWYNIQLLLLIGKTLVWCYAFKFQINLHL